MAKRQYMPRLTRIALNITYQKGRPSPAQCLKMAEEWAARGYAEAASYWQERAYGGQVQPFRHKWGNGVINT